MKKNILQGYERETQEVTETGKTATLLLLKPASALDWAITISRLIAELNIKAGITIQDNKSHYTVILERTD